MTRKLAVVTDSTPRRKLGPQTVLSPRAAGWEAHRTPAAPC